MLKNSNNLFNKELLNHIVALILFVTLTVVYFNPILEGKKVIPPDNKQFFAVSKEIRDQYDKNGVYPLWTNQLFCGIPSYMICIEYQKNIASHIIEFFKGLFPTPACYVFLYMIGFYVLFYCMNLGTLISITGSLALTLTSYNFIILEAGHNTKAMAIAFAGPLLGGIFLALRNKLLWGAVITAIGVALEIRAKHLQVTYYLLFLIGIITAFEGYDAIKEKRHFQFLKALGVLALAAIVGIGVNTSLLWTSYEFMPYTVRGKTILTSGTVKEKEGIGREAAFHWSYGFGENLTFLIADSYGGANGKPLTTKSKYYKALVDAGVGQKDAKEHIKSLPLYWGPQPFVAGPVYMGALICFLFVSGLFLIKGVKKWWILTAFLLSVFLAMGKNFAWLSDFFYDYVPYYNKFRAITMIQFITAIAMVIMSMFVLDQVVKQKINKKELLKNLKTSLYIVGGIALFFSVFPGMFYDFVGSDDQKLVATLDQNSGNAVLEALRSDRADILRMDSIRTLVFILLGFWFIILFINKKIGKYYFSSALTALIVVDMWMVNKRYLNNDDFVTKVKYEKPYIPNDVDFQIQKDKTPHYRVYDFTSDNPFADARTSFFHKSLGGFSPAMLRRYDDLIQKQFVKGNQAVISMMNARYIIFKNKQGVPVAQINPMACGNAWFINEVKMVNSPDEEIASLDNFDPRSTAFADKQYSDYLKDIKPETNPVGGIELKEYNPDYLVYEAGVFSTRLAVFSEIFYEKGWKAFLDGLEVPHIRVNYLLRAIKVPEGQHKIEFRFEPESYYTGEKISLAFSVILIGAILLTMAIYFISVFRKESKST